jgi:tetratricopeptide (TPR) repeat protein
MDADALMSMLMRGEGRDNARRFFMSRRQELLRLAVAMISTTTPVSDADRLQIAQFERQGWELARPFARLASGETDGRRIVEGIDPNSALVMQMLMESLNEALRGTGGDPRDSAAARDNSRGFFEENIVELRRIRQLASRERASSTVPRFGGADVTLEMERAHVRQRLLPRWEAGGWRLTEAVEALWRGTVDDAVLTRGVDRSSANVIRLMLRADDAPPASQPADSRPRFRALSRQAVTRSDDPNSRNVGVLNAGDVVTAVDGRRVVITGRSRTGSNQITRIRIGDNRWATETSTQGPTLLELIPRTAPTAGAGPGGRGGSLGQGMDRALLMSLLAAEQSRRDGGGTVSRKGVAELLEAGTAAIKAKNYELAVEKLSAAISIQPTEVLYGHRSTALRGLGRMDEALADAQLGIEVAPKALVGYVRKAEALQAMGKVSQALDALKAAAAADADSAPPTPALDSASMEAGLAAEILLKDYKTLTQSLEELVAATTVVLSLAAKKLPPPGHEDSGISAVEPVQLTVGVREGALALDTLYEAVASALSLTLLQVLDVYYEGELLDSNAICTAKAAEVIKAQPEGEAAPMLLDIEVVEDDAVPENYIDPIMSMVFVDPVVAGDGMSYERSSILRWLKDHDESPQTREKIPPTVLPNQGLKTEMIEFFEKEKKQRRQQRELLSGGGEDGAALVQQSSKQRLEAEVRRLEQVIQNQSVSITSATPDQISEGLPPGAQTENTHGGDADAGTTNDGADALAAAGASAQSGDTPVSELLAQLEVERRERQEAEDARRAVESDRAAAEAHLAAVQAEAASLRALLASSGIDSSLVLSPQSASPQPPAMTLGIDEGTPPPQPLFDTRSTIVIQTGEPAAETIEQTVARLRQERDELAAASASGGGGGGGSGAEAVHVASCFEERSVPELRQILAQLGGERITALLGASAPPPSRAILEKELNDVSGAARENPRWVPDGKTKVCMLCSEEFGLRRRRHHCRCCGWVTCADCCSGTVSGLTAHFSDDGQLIRRTTGSGEVVACTACVEAKQHMAASTVAMMQVEVPAGVVAGQMMVVNTPAGQTMQVAVPAGVAPGQMIQVNVPTTAPAAQEAAQVGL